MQDRPDKQTLLGEVARFLGGEVAGAIDDRTLAFRVKIAAHLLGTVARECHTESAQEAAEWASLQALFEGLEPDEGQSVGDAIRTADRRLVAELAGDDLSPEREAAIREHVLGELRGRLRVSNPRFDLDFDIE